jgi:hypothetical protein
VLGHLTDAVVVFSASPYPARACRKLQLAMQEQDTILEDGQAGHVDGLGSGSQTAASLPVTEGKKGRRCILGWRLLRRQPEPVIDLEGFGTLNFAEVEGPAWPMVPYRYLEEGRVSCQFGITSRTAEHQRRAWEGQGRAGQSGRCALWTRATMNPRKFFVVLGDRSTSRLAVVKLACVRSHFHITQPDQPARLPACPPACPPARLPACPFRRRLNRKQGASPKGGLGRAGRAGGLVLFIRSCKSGAAIRGSKGWSHKQVQDELCVLG